MNESPHNPRYRKLPDGTTERCFTTVEVYRRLLSLTKDHDQQADLKKQIKILEERERHGG
jgi:hypothetical protein